jgi:hypothetical protein
MIDNGRRFIAKALTRFEQTASELGVLTGTGYVAIRAGPEIYAEATVFLKHTLPKSHVAAAGRAIKFARSIS